MSAMPDNRLVPVPGNGDQSFKDVVTEACIFDGSREFFIIAMFHEKDIAGWYNNARCAQCGAWYKVPSPGLHDYEKV